MKKINIDLEKNSYTIYIEKNLLSNVGQYLKENFGPRKIAVITDENVEGLYGERLKQTIKTSGFNPRIITVKPGEESKTIRSLEEVYRQLSEFNITRNDLILTLGGGVVGDLGGFAASTYLRGVPYIQIPTSLLAQVDSSVGGKVAVDLPWGKNLVGSFYHPKAVFIDPELLKTLDERFLCDGLAEVIKYGCIEDVEILSTLLSYKGKKELLENIENIIFTCCNIKKHIVEIDEKDFGKRMILNFGHTIGHAIEQYFNYERYTHGEAVAIGMMEISKKGEELGITEKGTSRKIEEVLKKCKLPYKMPEVDRTSIIKAMTLDKKTMGENINLILLVDLGHVIIKKVEIKDIEKYI